MIFRTTSSAIALIALTAPAFADVTPAEVWQNWVSYYEANGYTVTEGKREQAGETLSLKDVVLAFKAPADDGAVNIAIPEITMTGTGDGKVRTVVSETSTVTASLKDPDGKAVDLNGNVVMKSAEMLTSGTAADMTHEFKAAEMAANLVSFKTEGVEESFPLSFKMLNAAGTQRMVDGPLTKIDATSTADRIEIEGAYEDKTPDTQNGELPGKVAFKGGIDAIKGSGTFEFPKGANLADDVNAALKAGLKLSAAMSAGAAELTFDYAGKDEAGTDKTAAGKTTFKGFDVNFAMTDQGLEYAGSGDSVTAEMTATDLPVPVSYAMEGSSFDVQMPVMKADAPAPFKLAYSIAGLTLGDGVWNLFDAQKALPRDPANVDVDVTGLLKVNVDMFDPAHMGQTEAADDAAAAGAGADAGTDGAAANAAGDAAKDGAAAPDSAAAAPEPEMPAEPYVPTEVTINKLAIEAVGAKIDASGSVKVPEGGSLDTPVGKVSARIDGANGLIDKLTSMGLIPADQVAGARMMLAMFAKPAPEGGDALVSEFEFKEGGEVLANGQKIK